MINQKEKKPFYQNPAFWIIVVMIVAYNYSENESTNQSTSVENTKFCFGNEGCISNVRENFTNTGKTILGEEYIGDGKFGISFMDTQHPSAFNAIVSTDCNCAILNVDVSDVK